MTRGRIASILAICALLSPASKAQTFQAADIAKGRQEFHRICSHCHGLNMVNAGTTVYDLRRFPVDDPERFLNSVTNGKGNMPPFKDSMQPEQIKLIWAYVGSRGGKEP